MAHRTTTDNAMRGVKRKREAHGKLEEIPSKLRAKLHHGLKEVKKASKKVKTFEMQKIVKKLKDARRSEDESNVKHLESQLECLKHIDLEGVAVRSLRSRIDKDALLSKNADCQAAVSSLLLLNSPANDSPVRSLVESRLLSSKILSSEITGVMQSLKLVLGAGRQEMPMSDGRGSVDGMEEREKVIEEKGAIATMKAPMPKQKARTKEIGNESEEDVDDEGEESSDDAAWTGFSDEILDESEQNDEVEWRKPGAVHSQDPNGLSSTSYDSQSTISSHQASSVKKARSAVAISNQAKGKAGESTFLPSLSVGFISGGSDSEWSDAEADLADAPVKKNRRGQRARKAIWEKKFGKNANHIKKQRENDVSATVQTAYDQRGGRGSGVSHGGIVRGRGRPIAEETHASPSHVKAFSTSRGRERGDFRRNYDTAQGHLGEKSKSDERHRDHGLGDDSKPLHPSWEAKRRLKEKESPAILPSMGTRLTFT